MRDDFPENVKRTVAARVAYFCSKPDCRASTSGPQVDPKKSLNVGVAAHITAAASGGPRFDATLDQTKRSSSDNAIWLCQTHAKLVDNDATRFPADLLRLWKSNAETEALAIVGKPSNRTSTRPDTVRLQLIEDRFRLLNDAASAVDGFLALFPGARSSLSFALPAMSDAAPPPLRGDLALRGLLVAQLKSELDRNRVMILTGSTGTGKTTLARLLIAGSEDRWTWIRFSDRSPREIVVLLSIVALSLKEARIFDRVVLDDLDLTSTTGRVKEEVLAGLFSDVESRNGQMLITNQRGAPSRLLRLLGATDKVVHRVPPFDEGEIAGLALRLGCPEDTASRLAKVVELHTRGHPQLVHARLRHLADSGWPSLSLEEIFRTPAEVLREQTDARVLLDQLSIEHREYIYRLSILGGPFRRDHAIALGEAMPGLQRPGEILDRLTGPWIEEIEGGYYRLSALLDKAADQVWSTEKVKSLHAAAANAFLRCGHLTTLEAGQVLLHSLVGRSTMTAALVAASILRSSKVIWKSLADHLSWITLVGVPKPAPIFPEDPFANFMLRLLQFRIAVETAPSSAAQIADLWDKEIVLGKSQEAFVMERYMFATTVLLNYSSALPAQKALLLLTEIAERQEQMRSFSKDIAWVTLTPKSPWAPETFDPLRDLFMFVIAQCSGTRFLEDLLSGLADLPADARDRIVTGLTFAEINARMLIDRVWLQETSRPQPDWEGCIRVFAKTMAQAQVWRSRELVTAAARGMAVVYEEYLGDPEKAIETLDSATAWLGHRGRLLEDERATIFLNQRKYSQALTIWNALLPDWHPPSEEFDLQPVFACRGAAIATAHTGNWLLAAQLFEECGRRAGTSGQHAFKVGLECDAGFALWKADAQKEAIRAWMGTLRSIETLSLGIQDPRLPGIAKLVGHTLLWVAKALGSKPLGELAVPVPGFCSDLERGDRTKALSPTPIELAWLHLVEIEYYVRSGLDALEETRRRFIQTPLPAVGFFLAEYEIRHSLRRLEVDDLPEMAVKYIAAAQMSATHRAQGKAITERSDVPVGATAGVIHDLEQTTTVFMAALAGLIGVRKKVRSTLKIWEQRTLKIGGGVALVPWFRLARSILSGPLGTAAAAMKDRESTQDTRLLSALRVASSREAMPGDLFYAHCTLVINLDVWPWLQAIGDQFCVGVTRQWLRAIDSPATIRSPRLTVPGIRKAIAAKSRGVAKIAGILLEASAAVDIRVPKDLSVRLRELAAGVADA